MTPEEKERLGQIRERQARYKEEPYAPDLWWDDTNFLLSHVKEQEPYTCEACGRSDEHTSECPTAAWCPGCGSRVIGHQWNTCHDAATAMRSACVEKVKECFKHSPATCEALVHELESLSIENQEK